jgi:hypothetical protein
MHNTKSNVASPISQRNEALSRLWGELSLKLCGGALLAALLASGCGRRPESPTSPAAQPSEASFKQFGNYEVHYNAIRADRIPAEVARAHGIERSKNRVMLNVTMLRKDADHEPRKPVKGTVSVDAYNLNGQLKSMDVRQVTEGEAIYYIGTVGIGDSEILVFDIKAQPENETAPFEVKFKREFFSD